MGSYRQGPGIYTHHRMACYPYRLSDYFRVMGYGTCLCPAGSGKSSTSYRGSEDFELKVHNLIKILKCKPDFLIINGLQVYQVYFFPDCHWIFQTDTRKVNLFF